MYDENWEALLLNFVSRSLSPRLILFFFFFFHFLAYLRMEFEVARDGRVRKFSPRLGRMKNAQSWNLLAPAFLNATMWCDAKNKKFYRRYS